MKFVGGGLSSLANNLDPSKILKDTIYYIYSNVKSKLNYFDIISFFEKSLLSLFSLFFSYKALCIIFVGGTIYVGLYVINQLRNDRIKNTPVKIKGEKSAGGKFIVPHLRDAQGGVQTDENGELYVLNMLFNNTNNEEGGKRIRNKNIKHSKKNRIRNNKITKKYKINKKKSKNNKMKKNRNTKKKN